jgi:hypothetical protein
MHKIFFLFVALSLTSFVNINQQFSSFAETNGHTPESIYSTSKFSRTNFEDSVKRLYDHVGLENYGLRYDVFRLGIIGFQSLRTEGKLAGKNLITIIDFTKPSTEKRFYTIDLDKKSVVYHSLVAHGRNTGENIAKHFSNKANSNQSSLGFYVTGESYVGSKGYSLRLDGQEKKYNGNMRNRAVVIHAADYVNESWIRKYGRIGRSQGCPALPNDINKAVIDLIKNKTVVFAYFNENDYLKSSAYLNLDRMLNGLDEELAASPIEGLDISVARTVAE